MEEDPPAARNQNLQNLQNQQNPENRAEDFMGEATVWCVKKVFSEHVQNCRWNWRRFSSFLWWNFKLYGDYILTRSAGLWLNTDIASRALTTYWHSVSLGPNSDNKLLNMIRREVFSSYGFRTQWRRWPWNWRESSGVTPPPTCLSAPLNLLTHLYKPGCTEHTKWEQTAAFILQHWETGNYTCSYLCCLAAGVFTQFESFILKNLFSEKVPFLPTFHIKSLTGYLSSDDEINPDSRSYLYLMYFFVMCVFCVFSPWEQ